ncbi:MAG TPA: Type 1 glutamine amidotransferase-like domain-containing protein [Calditrichia bacterium]|nr:Type 1 glutamine amidotransferase-like domain-containing protein [Calditrichota bacterium]HQU71381.1 Type 1 glutamine amidotransferase-like domain-containing protein [Calditrichia bacterium]HQV30867.1 Type 1 glutamine amidotransferase-like domain-containing protein [Calditrichia bacterium]
MPHLFLYSLMLSEAHHRQISAMVGKKIPDIAVTMIDNAADVIPGSQSWVNGFRKHLQRIGYRIEPLDLRRADGDPDGIFRELESRDVVWLSGGDTFYLRWILRRSGAEEAITRFLQSGKVYCGWSAGAIVAGPTTRFFDEMGDDPKRAPEIVEEGLGFCDRVIVPHLDNPDFSEGAQKTERKLREAGFKTLALKDQQAFVMTGSDCRILD